MEDLELFEKAIEILAQEKIRILRTISENVVADKNANRKIIAQEVKMFEVNGQCETIDKLAKHLKDAAAWSRPVDMIEEPVAEQKAARRSKRGA